MARLEEELARLRDLIDNGALVDGEGLLGVELEFHLIDDHARPSWSNAELLRALADAPIDLQTELARFNVELNLPPVALDRPADDGTHADGAGAGGALSTIRRRIDDARRAASTAMPSTHAVSIGTLPTLGPDDVTPEAISDRDRYRELDASIMGARGGRIELAIDGRDAGGERLDITLDTILLEAAATSLQIHLDLPADGLADAWNVAQAIAAVQVAVAANSPVLLGRRLWHESRVPLFEQLIDVRRPEERDPDSPHALPPRVWFGRRWIEHPADLFAENLELFRAPLVAEPDAAAEVGTEGGSDDLTALRLHNGTVWRWNRPVYAAHAHRPTLRIENRVLSAPPSAVDATADVALFVGLVAGLRDDVDALTAGLSFADADANFRTAARHGLSAELRWPGVRGTTTAGELLADRLIEVAAEGLAGLGMSDAEYGPALDVIAGRASEGRNGAAWQLATLEHEDEHHDRPTALARMLLRYRDLQEEGDPVHRWPWPGARTA